MVGSFIETLMFRPRMPHRVVSGLLWPVSLLYGGGMYLRRSLSRRRDPGIPVVSVGNLLVGGTGKTPMTVALARRYPKAAVVSRGYGRKSRGLVQVSRHGTILCDVERAGDEAMLMARSLPDSDVFVCEDRWEGIGAAKAAGAELVILDDGFNRVEIEKFELLMEREKTPNALVLPAGPFREFPSTAERADIRVREGRDFRRRVTLEQPTRRMILVTAISDPSRLDPWLPRGVVHRYRLADHAWPDPRRLRALLREYDATSLLVTQKDAVKLEGFKLPLSLLKLELEIAPRVFAAVDRYIKEYHAA